MSKTLTEIAQQLENTDKKVQLIYAFNGTGKTRLSREFKKNISANAVDDVAVGASDLAGKQVLYYSAFTEDLFFWDNDLSQNLSPTLKITPNSFINWVMAEQGQHNNIATHFQRYTNSRITPIFSHDFSEVSFTIPNAGLDNHENIKISKGEESNFIWSIFYTLIEQVVEVLNVHEKDNRETNKFNQLKYIFIDDPVSSLDENHLIELAFDLSALIKSSYFSNGKGLRFIISTHNPLFYNVLHNELGLNNGNKKDGCYLLEKFEDGLFNLNIKYGDSNKSFSYHLYLKKVLQSAIDNNQIERYHFMLLRNLYEKVASFLGYPEWTTLLDTVKGNKQGYINRVVQFSSHRTLSNEDSSEPSEPEKKMVELLLNNLVNNYGFWRQVEQHD